MSKERLEEIKERVIVDKVYYKYLDGTKGHWGKTYTLNEEDYNHLIEQAELVQELEEDNENLQILSNINRKEHMRIHEQNKRYREAREIIEQVYKENYVRNAYGYEDGYLDGLDTAIDIIDKALEGEE